MHGSRCSRCTATHRAEGEAARASTAATVTLVVAGQRSRGSKQQCAIQSLLQQRHVTIGYEGDARVKEGRVRTAVPELTRTLSATETTGPNTGAGPGKPPNGKAPPSVGIEQHVPFVCARRCARVGGGSERVRA